MNFNTNSNFFDNKLNNEFWIKVFNATSQKNQINNIEYNKNRIELLANIKDNIGKVNSIINENNVLPIKNKFSNNKSYKGDRKKPKDVNNKTQSLSKDKTDKNVEKRDSQETEELCEVNY